MTFYRRRLRRRKETIPVAGDTNDGDILIGDINSKSLDDEYYAKFKNCKKGAKHWIKAS